MTTTTDDRLAELDDRFRSLNAEADEVAARMQAADPAKHDGHKQRLQRIADAMKRTDDEIREADRARMDSGDPSLSIDASPSTRSLDPLRSTRKLLASVSVMLLAGRWTTLTAPPGMLRVFRVPSSVLDTEPRQWRRRRTSTTAAGPVGGDDVRP